jgi:hypothetical protein
MTTMALWLGALAVGAELPRRLIDVVHRRPVVDQATLEAMGGRLALVAELPNRPPVRLKGFSMLAGETAGLEEPHQPSRRRDNVAWSGASARLPVSPVLSG